MSCKGCSERTPGCHGKCPKYKEYRAELDAQMQIRARESECCGYRSARETKIKRNLARRRGKV